MMKRCLSPLVAWLAAVAALLSLPVASEAQLIPVKTVPLATGDQFDIFPSLNRGMGGVLIAMDDPLLDPFVNPAKGSKLRRSQLFVMPSLYHITDDLGVGRSLPVGTLFRTGDWFGALALSFQELDGPEVGPFRVVPPGAVEPSPGFTRTLDADPGSNIYGLFSFGRRLTETRTSFGVSVFAARLDALEGGELLFPTAADLDQSGHVLDLRIGFNGDLDGGHDWELLLLHRSQDMTYDLLRYVPEGIDAVLVQQEEEDRTDTWGVHVGYAAPFAGVGWRVGGILTANYKDHPHIPNYELSAIPRDPGETWAFDVGVGIARALEGTRFGIDLVFRPIWTDTWAEAESPTLDRRGERIAVGDKTKENDFQFLNALMRMGIGVEAERASFEMGLQMSSINYDLEQTDLILGTFRTQHESWVEWTPTWGAGLAFDGFDVHYTGRVTVGTGQPGANPVFFAVSPGSRAGRTASADYLPAPPGPLTLDDAGVFSHHVYVTVPIGG